MSAKYKRHPGKLCCSGCLSDREYDGDYGTNYGWSGADNEPCCCNDERDLAAE